MLVSLLASCSCGQCYTRNLTNTSTKRDILSVLAGLEELSVRALQGTAAPMPEGPRV
jgi:hypothetical protein